MGSTTRPAPPNRSATNRASTVRRPCVRPRSESFCEVGARTKVAESAFSDYSYVVNDSDIIYTTLGKFCSIAAHTRINPGNHPLGRVMMSHVGYRSSAYGLGPDDAGFFDWRRSTPVTLGHDVWIGHGAVVLPGVEHRHRGCNRCGRDRHQGRAPVRHRRRQSRAGAADAVPRAESIERLADDRLVGLAARSARARAMGDFRTPLGAAEFCAKYAPC